jgi:hypothetical protein
VREVDRQRRWGVDSRRYRAGNREYDFKRQERADIDRKEGLGERLCRFDPLEAVYADRRRAPRQMVVVAG